MEWRTPQELFERLDSEYHFNLDAAANEFNAKCEKYYTVHDNGLAKMWGGYNVFVNPPYGRDISKWVRKGYTEGMRPDTVVVMLIPARTDTSYWHDYIFGKAYEVRFIRGRIRFLNESGQQLNSAPFPSAVVVWKMHEDKTKYSTLY